MAKITPGNRVYLYQLLSRELGVNRQTLLPRAEEALVADGLAPADLGCADMRELCEQLPEFIKLTVFKKGYVYATVLACEEYDRALERTQDAGDKAAASGKPWKRKRGAKALKPVRPRHIEPPARKDEKDEKDGDAVVEAVVPDGTEAAGGAAPAEVAAHEGEPTSSVGEASEAAPEPDAAHAEEGPAEVAPSDAAPSGEEASGTGVDGGNASNTANQSGQTASTVVAGAVDWNMSRDEVIAEWTQRIDAYLSGSPLAGYGSVFATAAWDNGVDPRWSPAIACTESSMGAYCFRDYNAWGWMTSRQFGSWEESITAHVAFLAKNYGATLTPKAAQTYCPPTWQHWYNTVGGQMNLI